MRHRIFSMLVAGGVVLSLLPSPALASSEGSVFDVGASIEVTYSASTEPGPVGEARPPLPDGVELPEGVTLPVAGGEFRFELRCLSTPSGCESDPVVKWSFGDGSSATAGPIVFHSFATPGIYRVRADISTSAGGVGRAATYVFVSPHFGDVFAQASYQSVVLGTSPSGYWPFDGSTDDLTSSAPSGVAYGGSPSFELEVGIAQSGNQALVLDNTTSLRFAEFAGFAQNAFGVQFWVRPTSSQGLMLAYGEDAVVLSNPANLSVQVAGAQPVVTGVELLPGVWSHLALDWESYSGRLRVFVNGVAQAEFNYLASKSGSLPAVADLVLGGGAAAAFDELAVYNKTFSPAHLSHLHSAGLSDASGGVRPDRASIWATSSLGLFDPCGFSTSNQGTFSGRPNFCPEPQPLLDYVTPVAVPASNGVSEVSCLASPSTCQLPAEFFTGDTQTTEAALIAAGYLSPEGNLLVRNAVCGDGWKLTGPDAAVAGEEEGCLTRFDWAQALVRGVDGHDALLSDLPASGEDVCADDSSVVFRRALFLGLIELRYHPQHQDGFCEEESSVSRREVYKSVAALLGVIPDDVPCSPVLRDLFDPELADEGPHDPDCSVITAAVEAGAPVVGDVACPDGVGVCLHPDAPLTRAQAGVLLSGLLVNDSVTATTLTVSAAASPRPVNTPVTVTVHARLPLTITDDLIFVFPESIPGLSRTSTCDLSPVTPLLFGDFERRAQASCVYLPSEAGSYPLTIEVGTADALHVATAQVVVSATNEPPQTPITALSTLGESTADVFPLLSSDPNGDDISFEVSQSQTRWFPRSDVYESLVLADLPSDFWPLTSDGSNVVPSRPSAAISGQVTFTEGPLVSTGSGAAVFSGSWTHLVAEDDPSVWLSFDRRGFVTDHTDNTSPHLLGPPAPAPGPWSSTTSVFLAAARDRVVVPQLLSQAVSSFSLEMWLRVPADAGPGTILQIGGAGGLVLRNPSQLTLNLAGVSHQFGVNLADNSWHHVVLVVDASELKARVYVDGVEEGVSSLAVSSLPSGANLVVGSASSHVPFWLGDVVFYDQVLTETTIAGRVATSSAGRVELPFSPGDTVELWFAVDENPDIPQVIASAGGTGTGWALILQSDTLWVSATDDYVVTGVSQVGLADLPAHHVVVGPAGVFVNGAQLNFVGSWPTSHPAKLTLGAPLYQTSLPSGPSTAGFVGRVAGVAVYDALSVPRVQVHTEAGFNRLLVSTANGNALGLAGIDASASSPMLTLNPVHTDVSGTASFFLRACDHSVCSPPSQHNLIVLPEPDPAVPTSSLLGVTVEGGPAVSGTLSMADLRDRTSEAGTAQAWRILSAPPVGTLQYLDATDQWTAYTGGLVETSSAELRYLPDVAGAFSILVQGLDTGTPTPQWSAPFRVWVLVAHSE